MIGGMMNKPPEMAHVPPNWQIYFRVPDINAAAEAVKANGGTILNGPMEVPGGGLGSERGGSAGGDLRAPCQKDELISDL
jgi:predicted enzyme related to lactoylglutathione lyase